jgi:sarcosine/dimethylglycine N-methyltransferase
MSRFPLTTMPVDGFYDGPELEPVVLDALRAAGRSLDPLDSDDLAGMDEFHAVGRAGTLAMAELVGVGPGHRVLDLGAGIGGPSRALARHFAASVTALDPTARFCRLASALNARCGLADRVTVVQGDGAALPFPDDSFDLVWTQALWQSVPDKPALSAEIDRVLRPGGRLSLLEVVSEDGAELEYPVPWADGPEQSFVVSDRELRETFAQVGLEPLRWLKGEAVQAPIAAAATSGALPAPVPGIGLELLLPDYEARMAGLSRNLENGHINLVMAVLARAGVAA